MHGTPCMLHPIGRHHLQSPYQHAWLRWDDAAEAGPAVLAMIAMPFTYSISNGIALAFVSYALIKIFTGKFGETSPAIWVIAALSVVSFLVS